MPLELGLGRITRLLNKAQPFSWNAIHVAGTNGKGSVCSYASSILRKSGVTVGQFSTPHLLDRWDCIQIHGLPIAKQRFDSIMTDLESFNQRERIEATEFELLTAAAFRAFTDYRLDVGIVEVGLGGRLDATNVLEKLLATVITKIGMDHEAVLGNTLEKIAIEKAGIMKPGVPCYIDATNPPSLHDLFLAHAEDVGAGPVEFVNAGDEEHAQLLEAYRPSQLKLAPHQLNNLVLAHTVACAATKHLDVDIGPSDATRQLKIPGRLHRTRIDSLTSRQQPVLLDGAHNPQAAAALGSYVDAHLRKGRGAVTWLLAITDTKDAKSILKELLRSRDSVVTAEFGPVDGMPWVKPYPAERLLRDAEAVTRLWLGAAPGRKGWLETAVAIGSSGPLIVCGSLYLVAELYRDLRSGQIDPSRALPKDIDFWRIRSRRDWVRVPRGKTGPELHRHVYDHNREKVYEREKLKERSLHEGRPWTDTRAPTTDAERSQE